MTASSHPRGSPRRAGLATILGASLLALAACTDQGPEFNLTNVTGKMPDLKFRLADARGETRTAADLRGQAVLMYFGYTHCPDACPMTLGRVKTALAKLPDKLAEQTTVVFVTVDPTRDTPERLRSYLANFHLPNAVGLIGKGEGFKRLKERYHVYSKLLKDGPDDTTYEVNHPSQVYVFGPDGRARLLASLSGRNPDSPEALAEDLKKLL
jgi:protein SCO1/2